MSDSECKRLVETVLADEAEMVAFTQELVSIPSENPPGTFYEPCVGAIASKLTELGMEFERVEVPVGEPISSAEFPRFALIAHLGTGKDQLHFHGHYDVVPANSESQFHPFIEDGQLHGRGSSDMKSGLASMIYAMKAIKTCGVELNGSIRLAIVPDEETGGALGSKYLFEAGLIGDSSVGMLTAEPTDGAIWNASRGAISLLVTIKGVPMHVGLQHEGVNAFEKMITVANALNGLKQEVEARVTGYNIRPESARRSILMLGGRCEGGTNFNLVPGRCSFTIDRRINPEEDLDTEKQRLFDVLVGLRRDGIEIEVETLQEGRSAGVSEHTSVAQSLAHNVEHITGIRPEFEMCPGLLEIRFYAEREIPAFAYGPGILSVSHGPDEYVPIKNIVDTAAVYALTACDLLS